jgi:hypothetical protein
MKSTIVPHAQIGRAKVWERIKEVLGLLRNGIYPIGRDLIIRERQAGAWILNDGSRQQSTEVSRVPGSQRRIGVHHALAVIDRILEIGKEEGLVLSDGAADAQRIIVINTEWNSAGEEVLVSDDLVLP